MGDKDESGGGTAPCHGRRAVLKAALGAVLGLQYVDSAAAQGLDPRSARPQEDDRFVFAAGERKGALITPEDLPLGGPPVMALPMDPKTATVRDGSRLNQVLLIRLDPEVFAQGTRAHSAAGIVAYSAICTHAGCEVSDWQAEKKTLMCFCHFSEFDPQDGARVVDGPAPRRLAALPLKVVNGVLMAAGGFLGRVGFEQG